jgi:hypothetical protein
MLTALTANHTLSSTSCEGTSWFTIGFSCRQLQVVLRAHPSTKITLVSVAVFISPPCTACNNLENSLLLHDLCRRVAELQLSHVNVNTTVSLLSVLMMHIRLFAVQFESKMLKISPNLEPFSSSFLSVACVFCIFSFCLGLIQLLKMFSHIYSLFLYLVRVYQEIVVQCTTKRVVQFVFGSTF